MQLHLRQTLQVMQCSPPETGCWFKQPKVRAAIELKSFAEGYFLERATLDWFFANYLPAGTDTKQPRISPLAASSFTGLPPAYLMTAECDPLHDEGIRYAEKLKAAGVKVEIADHPGLVHDFIYLQAVLPQAPQALKEAAAALKSALTAG